MGTVKDGVHEKGIKEKKSLTTKQKVIRTVALVLTIVLVIALVATCAIDHFTVFGWNYSLGRYIYEHSDFEHGCVLGSGTSSLLLSHAGLCYFDVWGGQKYAPLATLRRVILTKSNFDRHFDTGPLSQWHDDLTPERLRQENRAAWVGYAQPDGARRVICVLLQKDGSVIWLLGIGSQSNEPDKWETFHFLYGREIQPVDNKDLYYDELKKFLERQE